MRSETVPVMTELGATVRTANVELDRLHGVLGRAESIGGTVDSASRLAYTAFSNPALKAIALASGTSRAATPLRQPRSGSRGVVPQALLADRPGRPGAGTTVPGDQLRAGKGRPLQAGPGVHHP